MTFSLRYGLPLALAISLAGCLEDQKAPTPAPEPANANAMAALGKKLFNDTSLSANSDQSCASCHTAPASNASPFFFTDPDTAVPVSEGSFDGSTHLFGTRNSPTAAYTAFVPALHAELDEGDVLMVGGLFLDGRVDSLEEQASKPFFNPVEMNNATVTDLVNRLRNNSAHRAEFEAVFGAGSLVDTPASDDDENQVLTQLTQAIAAFERTPEVSPFTSKFDYYLQGKAQLSAPELRGLSLFVRADKGNCAACHVMNRGANGQAPMFTDFTYDNLGVPRHPDRTKFAADFVDDGLAKTLRDKGLTVVDPDSVKGKFRVPTLRNIAKTAPYMHNGVFIDLRTVVEFYSTRDTDPQRWAAIGDTEVPATVNHDELGKLGLGDREIDDIVAFMNTLSDGYTP